MKKQVEKDHYKFSSYMSKQRWASMWNQVSEVLEYSPGTVLEIGPGPGIFKALVTQLGMEVKTLDIDSELQPDYVGSADCMPFCDGEFDVVCAFQMLEHVPYEMSLAIFREMVRVAKKGIVVSLPDAKAAWPCVIHIPKVGPFNFHIHSPRVRLKEHVFDGEHHWEINKAGYSLSRIRSDLEKVSGVTLIRTYRVNENPYHRFFVFRKSSFKD
ncbi:class I SAM-dependent methyltransferase [Marinobacter sp.]|uniref:class I SAM-dependent methyltransferase n=1 Tax=Marinobacter sp. TaxID=50741 RepID=UPI0034A555D5